MMYSIAYTPQPYYNAYAMDTRVIYRALHMIYAENDIILTSSSISFYSWISILNCDLQKKSRFKQDGNAKQRAMMQNE